MQTARDNVTDISHRVSPFPQASKLYFDVAQKPLYYVDPNCAIGSHATLASHKLIVRKDDKALKPLAVVGHGYKVIPNSELFPYVEQRMIERLGPSVLRDVQVTEDMSYGGRDCYRNYVFPSVRCDVPGGGDVAFRLIIGNSYGAKAVQLIAGAIDFFCTNGMILGVHESVARKHTSGLTLTGLDKWIGDSVTYFTKHTETMRRWTDILIPRAREDDLFKHLVAKNLVSERHATQLNEALHYERNRRSGRDVRPALWHLYAALTAWSSHGDIRDTGNDHAANTRIERGRHANRIMSVADDFLRKAA